MNHAEGGVLLLLLLQNKIQKSFKSFFPSFTYPNPSPFVTKKPTKPNPSPKKKQETLQVSMRPFSATDSVPEKNPVPLVQATSGWYSNQPQVRHGEIRASVLMILFGIRDSLEPNLWWINEFQQIFKDRIDFPQNITNQVCWLMIQTMHQEQNLQRMWGGVCWSGLIWMELAWKAASTWPLNKSFGDVEIWYSEGPLFNKMEML